MLYMSICDLFFNLKLIFEFVLINDLDLFDENVVVTRDSICHILSIVVQFFAMGTISWSMMISVYLLFLFASYRAESFAPNSYFWRLTKARWPYHCYVWGTSFIHCLILELLNAFGPTPSGCYISNPYYMLFFTVPQFIYMVFSVVILFYNIYQLAKLNEMLKHRALFQVEFDCRKQLVKYVLVFVIFWTIPLVDEILRLFDAQSFYSSIMNSASISVQAVGNAIVWGTAPEFISLFKRKTNIETKEEQAKLISFVSIRNRESTSIVKEWDNDITVTKISS